VYRIPISWPICLCLNYSSTVERVHIIPVQYGKYWIPITEGRLACAVGSCVISCLGRQRDGMYVDHFLIRTAACCKLSSFQCMNTRVAAPVTEPHNLEYRYCTAQCTLCNQVVPWVRKEEVR
jgi:hypothetical protein